MNSQFNAIDYSHQLQAVGVSQAQAEMHAKLLSQALANCAATRADLAELRTELTSRMEVFETRITLRMEEFEASVKLELAKMRTEIAEMRSEMRTEMATMRTEMATMRTEIKYHRRMMNLILALQVALIVKLFFP
jgi:hypothetical protein